MTTGHVIVAITGASGSVYGLRLVERLIERNLTVSLLITQAGRGVMREETAVAPDVSDLREHFGRNAAALRIYDINDLMAPIASGSGAADAMVVCPCSMGTLARISGGISGNLLERAADVMLKERRPLVLVPRETPLNEIHLENMLRLARLGARIVPAMPAFYHHPETLDDIVDFLVGRVLDTLGVAHNLYRRWGAPVEEGSR